MPRSVSRKHDRKLHLINTYIKSTNSDNIGMLKSYRHTDVFVPWYKHNTSKSIRYDSLAQYIRASTDMKLKQNKRS